MMTNMVMALASNIGASTPVELSLSPFFHYHYSASSKVLKEWDITDADFRRFIAPYVPPPRLMNGGQAFYALSHDFTKVIKAHSPCLEGRQYVPTANNVVAGNRALGVGYPLAALHLGAGEAGWCPPFSLRRVSPQEDGNAVAVEQIMELLADESLPFPEHLCVLRADAGYGKASFLSPLYGLDQMVAVVRLRQGIKVYGRAADGGPTGGAPRVYGDKQYLTDASKLKDYTKKGVSYQVWQQSIFDKPCDDAVEVPSELRNGRKVIIETKRWNNLLIRSKGGANMKDKPFDVLHVRVLDAQTRLAVFDRALWLAVSGKRKADLDSDFARSQYRERYDVEPYYRYAKQKMLLDKLQTPNVTHFDRWTTIVKAATWLVFTARQEVTERLCPKWQKYLPENKASESSGRGVSTIAQVHKSIQSLFCTFDPVPFLPQKSKKGTGRKKGDTRPKRKRFKVQRKAAKNPKIRSPG